MTMVAVAANGLGGGGGRRVEEAEEMMVTTAAVAWEEVMGWGALRWKRTTFTIYIIFVLNFYFLPFMSLIFSFLTTSVLALGFLG